MNSPSASIRRRKLGHELRRYREVAGPATEQHPDGTSLSHEQVARATGWSIAKVGRMERAQVGRPAIGDIETLCELYDVPLDEREALLTLAREARKRGWWDQFSDVHGPSTVAAFEAEAVQIRTWEPILIPGLLQSSDYALKTIQAEWPPPTDQEAARLVQARMTRQVVFEVPHPPTLWAILDERTLDFASPDQLRKLAAAAERSNITIQVLRSADMHAGLYGPFTLLEFIDHPPVVVLDTPMDAAVILDRSADHDRFRGYWEIVCGLALGAPESARLLAEKLSAVS